MRAFTFTMADHTSSVAPARLFKALCLEDHNLIPKIMPQTIKSIDLVGAKSTVIGCIKQFNCPQGSPFTCMKNEVGELDVENFYIRYTTFEGDFVGDKLECIVYDGKVEAFGVGSRYKLTAHLLLKKNVSLTEKDVKVRQESIKGIHQAVENYLVSNPEVYA